MPRFGAPATLCVTMAAPPRDRQEGTGSRRFSPCYSLSIPFRPRGRSRGAGVPKSSTGGSLGRWPPATATSRRQQKARRSLGVADKPAVLRRAYLVAPRRVTPSEVVLDAPRLHIPSTRDGHFDTARRLRLVQALWDGPLWQEDRTQGSLGGGRCRPAAGPHHQRARRRGDRDGGAAKTMPCRYVSQKTGTFHAGRQAVPRRVRDAPSWWVGRWQDRFPLRDGR